MIQYSKRQINNFLQERNALGIGLQLQDQASRIEFCNGGMRAKSRKRRAKSRERRAKREEQRSKSKEQGAVGRKQKAKELMANRQKL
jgi:hypothetical protein